MTSPVTPGPAPDCYAMPAGACDCHTHVFGPASRFPYWSGRTYTPPDASLADIKSHLAALGLSRVVIVHPSPYGADNACTVDALRQLGPDVARGVAVIDKTTSDADLEAMHKAGMRGARVNLETAGVHDPAAARAHLQWTAARVAPLGWHVQTYTNLGVIEALHDAMQALPTPLVIDHFGRAQAAKGTAQPGFDKLLSLVGKGKAYVKISAAYRISQRQGWPDVQPIARALIDANAERVVWGSDWPHPGGSSRAAQSPTDSEPFLAVNDRLQLNLLTEWIAKSEQLGTILVDNPARLYGF